MNGKICLITGANRGIGKVVTHHLAELGATAVMLCRNSEAGEAVRDEIIAQLALRLTRSVPPFDAPMEQPTSEWGTLELDTAQKLQSILSCRYVQN